MSYQNLGIQTQRLDKPQDKFDEVRQIVAALISVAQAIAYEVGGIEAMGMGQDGHGLYPIPGVAGAAMQQYHWRTTACSQVMCLMISQLNVQTFDRVLLHWFS